MPSDPKSRAFLNQPLQRVSPSSSMGMVVGFEIDPGFKFFVVGMGREFWFLNYMCLPCRNRQCFLFLGISGFCNMQHLLLGLPRASLSFRFISVTRKLPHFPLLLIFYNSVSSLIIFVSMDVLFKNHFIVMLVIITRSNPILSFSNVFCKYFHTLVNIVLVAT